MSPLVRLPESVRMISAGLHPAYALRGFPQMMPLIRDVVARNVAGRKMPPLEVKVGATSEVVGEMLDKTPIAVMDVETDLEGRINLISVADARDPRRVVVARWTDAVARRMEPWLACADHAIVGHNFAFDFSRMVEHGLNVSAALADTMNLCALILPAVGRAKKMKWLSLEACVLRYVSGWPAWKPTRRKNGEVDWKYAHALYRGWFPEIPDWLHEELYCGVDSGATGALWQVVVPLAQQIGVWDLFKDVVCPAIPVLARMTMRGIKISEERRALLKKQAEERLEKAAASVKEQTQALHDARCATLDGEKNGLLIQAKGREDGLEGGCPLHKKYKGKAKPRSTREGCVCKAIFERNAPAWVEIRTLRKQANAKKAALKQLGETFAVGNPNAWRWLLYDELGLVAPPSARSEPTKAHPEGQSKVDLKALEALTRKYEGKKDLAILAERMAIAHALHRWNAKKGNGTLAVEVDGDGFAHYQFNLHKSNGRIASGKDEEEEGKWQASPGNGLNIMKPDRSMYVPSSPDNCFLSLDFSQIEARIVAFKAGDMAMLRALREGKDLHCMTAALMFGIPMERAEETRTNKMEIMGRTFTQRYIMKRIKHGKNYGMGVQRAVDETGLPYEMVAAAFRADDEMWPGVARWQAETKWRIAKDRMLVNSWGRIHRAYDFRFSKKTKRWEPSSDALKEGLAFVPQTDASEILKSVLPAVWSAARRVGAWVVLPPHDQVLIDCPRNAIESLARTIKGIMEQRWPQLGVIKGYEEEFGYFWCPVDVEVGENWGEEHLKHNEGCAEGCLLNMSGMRKMEV